MDLAAEAMRVVEESADPSAAFEQQLLDRRVFALGIEALLLRLSPATLRQFDARVLNTVATLDWQNGESLRLLMQLCPHIDPNTRMWDSNPAWFSIAMSLRQLQALLLHSAELRIDVNLALVHIDLGVHSPLWFVLRRLSEAANSQSLREIQGYSEIVSALVHAGALPLTGSEAEAAPFRDLVPRVLLQLVALGSDIATVDAEALGATGLPLGQAQLTERLGADFPGLAQAIEAFHWGARASLMRAMYDWTQYGDEGEDPAEADFVGRAFHGHPADEEDRRLVNEYAQLVALFRGGRRRRARRVRR